MIEPEGISEESGELYEHFRFIADKGQSPLRIDKYVMAKIGNASRNRIQNAARAGNILVNGTVVKPSYKVRPCDLITIVLAYPPRDTEIYPENIPINIVFEDDDIIVVNKVPGMVVHPGHGNYSGTLVNAMLYHFRDLPLFREEDPRPGLVHRIDKDTSGLLVVAKTEMAKMNLANQFFEKSTQRKYIALVWGDLKQETGTITGNIGRSPNNRLIFCVFPNGDQGKHAVTHYKVVERLGYVNLIECRLETGRTHQIRVHMKYIGHPLFNDATYGGDQILRGTTFTKYRQFVRNVFDLLPRQALHAQSLGFLHPVSGQPMLFETPLPADMATAIDRWRTYISNRDIIEPNE